MLVFSQHKPCVSPFPFYFFNFRKSLRKVCQNTGFSVTRIFPYKDGIFDSLLTWENKGNENTHLGIFRSSHRRCPVRKGVLRNFATFIGKHLCQSPLLHSSVCSFIKKENRSQVFPCEFCEVSRNTFFTEHLWATTSVYFTEWMFWVKGNVLYYVLMLCLEFFGFFIFVYFFAFLFEGNVDCIWWKT